MTAGQLSRIHVEDGRSIDDRDRASTSKRCSRSVYIHSSGKLTKKGSVKVVRLLLNLSIVHVGVLIAKGLMSGYTQKMESPAPSWTLTTNS